MRRKLHRREKKLINMKILIFGICLICIMSVGFAAFETNITLNAKGNVKLKPITIDELKEKINDSSNGLYKVSDRYIYSGSAPYNYITLNSDIYRIISIENDNSLKVVKEESIGDFVFDDKSRFSSDSSYYCYGDSSYVGCNIWGSKTTMLDSSGNNVESIDNLILPDSEAYINTYLNSTWYNLLDDDLKNSIVTHVFNVGTLNLVSGQTIDTDLSQESSYKWKGNIGLINVTDYVLANSNKTLCGTLYMNGYHTSNEEECGNTNWMYSLISGYTISPRSYNKIAEVYYIDGNLGQHSGLNNCLAIHPVFYLSGDILLTGTGNKNNTYKLSI